MTPFTKSLVASLAVAVASAAFYPLSMMAMMLLPQPMAASTAFLLHFPFGMELKFFALVGLWIYMVVRAMQKYGRRGLWLLIALPIVLPTAYFVVAVYVSCFFFDYCL